MLKFLVFEDGQPAQRWPIRNPYLVGSDNAAMRATVTLEDGAIVCDKRDTGAAALALQVPAGECGELTLQTCLTYDDTAPRFVVIAERVDTV